MDSEAFERIKSAVCLAASHVVEKGCDDIFKPPMFSSSLEQDIVSKHKEVFINKAVKDSIKFIKSADMNSQTIGNVINTLIVKDNYTFRQVSWLDPFDVVKYLSLSILMFDCIESARIKKNLNVVHSHRKSDSLDKLFDPKFGYNSFRAASGELSRSYVGKWKVVTDISNFFDRIGNHSLENHLEDIGCERTHINLLKNILYYWAGDRRSFGVPIGSDASRIVSEAALVNVDRTLHERGVKFIRYVDDFRIFAETRAEAYDCMHQLITLLANEGLSVNSKKTRIYRVVSEDELSSDVNDLIKQEHQPINESEKVEIRIRSNVSGRSTISKFYREPGREAIEKIKLLNFDSIMNEFHSAAGSEEESKMRLAIKYFLYAAQNVEIIKKILDKKMNAIFYIVDALIKENDRLIDEKKTEILNAIFHAIDYKKCAYPYKIPLLRLSATDGFENKELVNYIVDEHRTFDNKLFLKEAITLGYNQLDRARIRKLAQEVYPDAPDFIKRSIYFAVQKTRVMSDDERRPLLLNMRVGTNDWFVEMLAEN